MPNDPCPPDPVVVDIWHWFLDQPTAGCVDDCAILSEDERVRAGRFLRDVDRMRYVGGRARLRRILGHQLGIDARAVRIVYNAWGKPALDLDQQGGLHFNLSHSAGEAVLAVSAEVEIGIDIEEIRPLEEDVASHFFSRLEYAALSALPEEGRLAGFYRCWTRKEAFVKAHGAGLSVPLDGFDVSLHAEEGQRLLIGLDPAIGLVDDWTLLNLDVVSGFCGALAVCSRGREIEVHYRSSLA